MTERPPTTRPSVPIRRRTVLRGTAAGTAAALGVPHVGADEHGDETDDEDEAANGDGSIVSEGAPIALETVTDELTAPVGLVTTGDDDGRLFLLDQTGYVYVYHTDDEPVDDTEDDESMADDEAEDVPDADDVETEDDPEADDVDGENDADDTDADDDGDDNGDTNGALEVFLEPPADMVDIDDAFDERGLLGFAFHPDFAENGQFFVRYSAEGTEPEYGAPGTEVPDEVDHLDRLSRFETTDDENAVADPDSEEIVLEIAQPQFNHNAGPILFGPDDGYLYVSTGDGGGSGDADDGHVDDWYGEIDGGNGQDTEHNLLGGILRIDVDDEGDDERAYGIPDDNPLVDSDDHLPEYWAWGLRNPWRMSFEDGELLVGDVGQALFEIVNHVEAGGNYGWNPWEGTHCFDPDTPQDPPEDCPAVVDDVAEPRGGEPLLGPVIEYPQEADMGRYADEYDDAGTLGDDRDRIGTAIIGGYIYEGEAVPDLDGAYIFGDWSWSGDGGGRIFSAQPPEGWPENGEGVDDDHETDDEDETNDDHEAADANGDDEVDGDGEVNGDGEANDDQTGTAEDSPYHPPDEVDLWDIEEHPVESDDATIAEDGLLQSLVYAFGRDDDGEMYVLSSDTSTTEGTGYLSRIVAPEEVDEEADDEEADDEEADDEMDDDELEDDELEDDDLEDDDDMEDDDVKTDDEVDDADDLDDDDDPDDTNETAADNASNE